MHRTFSMQINYSVHVPVFTIVIWIKRCNDNFCIALDIVTDTHCKTLANHRFLFVTQLFWLDDLVMDLRDDLSSWVAVSDEILSHNTSSSDKRHMRSSAHNVNPSIDISVERSANTTRISYRLIRTLTTMNDPVNQQCSTMKVWIFHIEWYSNFIHKYCELVIMLHR